MWSMSGSQPDSSGALGVGLAAAGAISYGIVLAALIVGVAWRVGALSRAGGAAAVVLGTASVAAGWSWGALLALYFVASVALTRFRSAAKAERVGALVAKGGPRDATQVLANGGNDDCRHLQRAP
jgi:uncharacterized membrane protein